MIYIKIIYDEYSNVFSAVEDKSSVICIELNSAKIQNSIELLRSSCKHEFLHVREMYSQMQNDTSYINMFMNMAKMSKPNTLSDVPTYILVPSYILHELTVAFKIGVLLYIPFIIIDMVVASILMAMGMMMLPPVQISMPFKLILFVLVDGWGLLTQQLFISVIK